MNAINLTGSNYVATLTFPVGGSVAVVLPPGLTILPAGVQSPGGASDSLSAGQAVMVVTPSGVTEYHDRTLYTDFFAGMAAAFPMVLTLICVVMVKRGLRPTLDHG